MIVTIEIKDKILDFIVSNRNGSFISIEADQCDEEFGINFSLTASFFQELESKGFVRNLKITNSSVSCFTVSSLDSFFEQGGFTTFTSIRNVVNAKILVEAELLSKKLKEGNLKEGDLKDILSISEKLLSATGSLISILSVIDK